MRRKNALAEGRRLNPNLTVKWLTDHAPNIPPLFDGLRKAAPAFDGSPNFTFLCQSRPKLFRPLIPSSTCGIGGGLRRFTEVGLNEQSLPVA